MSSVAEEVDATQPQSEFVKAMSLTDATMLVAGSMIGSGIFIVSASISREVVSPFWLIMAWLVTGVITMLGALAYGEMAAMYPRAGGQYVFLRESMGPLMGFLYGWTLFVVIQTGTIAAVAVAFGRFLGVLIPDISPDRFGWFPQGDVCVAALGCTDRANAIQLGLSPQRVIALISVWVLTWINLRGVREGKMVQTTLTIVKTGALAILILLGLTIGRNAAAISANFSSGNFFAAPDINSGFLIVFGAALVGSLFSSDAWNNVTFAAAEVKNPSRNLPLALVLGTGLVSLLYVLANFSYLSVLPLAGDASATTAIGRGIANATQDRVGTAAAEVIFGGSGATLMAIAILISTFGCNNGLISAGARVYYAMARDGLFFRKAGTLNDNRVPGRALVVQSVWVSLLCLTGTYNQLLNYVIFAALLFYALTTVGLFILRSKRPDIPRPYKAVGYPVLPALYIVLASAVAVILLIAKSTRTEAFSGLVLVILGIPVYYLWRKVEAGKGTTSDYHRRLKQLGAVVPVTLLVSATGQHLLQMPFFTFDFRTFFSLEIQMIRMGTLFRRALPFALTLLLALFLGNGPATVAAQDTTGNVDSAIATDTSTTLAGNQHAGAAQHRPGGEANLVIPDLNSGGEYLGLPGRTLLMWGLVICVLGLVFGLVIYGQLKRMPVHESMLEISELIYETCKTYLVTQGKFILILEIFIGAVIALYFGFLVELGMTKVLIILLFSLIGIAGSYGVAWFGIRVNTFANSRTAFASLRGKPYPCYAIPLKAGMSIGMLLISVELFIMLCILLFIPGDYAGPCFIGFAIGESLGAAALRIAGGIFTKIADIGADLMKIVFNIKEDDARNPGVIADCTGDNAGDSVGPSADGFETYGVTGVALISFILLAVTETSTQVQLLVWIFAMRIMMIIASGLSYLANEAVAKARYVDADKMNYEAPLTSLVWLTSIVSVALTFLVSYLLIPDLGDGSMWWKLSAIITCGTLAGAIIPELVKIFTSTESSHTKEVVTSSREGGASLNILSGLVAGNFSAFWLGLAIMGLMAVGYWISMMGVGAHMIAPAVFAFGLVAFGFLGMGPVTIAVDSYGPVTDNAQSVFELSTIEQIPGIAPQLKSTYGFDVNFERAKHLLEENDGAGNTFKATAKPVLIGTAVVGATTMIFAIIVTLTNGLQPEFLQRLSILHPPFLLGLIAGGSVIYWFTGASIQAVTTGAYRAVEFIKANIKLEGSTRASVADSKKVVEICTQYAQKGMFNIFLTVFFATLAFAFAEPFFFIGYLISIALFGLFQAIFMANAGGAWDNAKKIVEVELKQKGTPLHAATVVGDTVGDPFKDTSSVALNPIIKFTTLFGLLAVELAVSVSAQRGNMFTNVLSAAFFVVALVFVWRSFYAMRIESPWQPWRLGNPPGE